MIERWYVTISVHVWRVGTLISIDPFSKPSLHYDTVKGVLDHLNGYVDESCVVYRFKETGKKVNGLYEFECISIFYDVKSLERIWKLGMI
jgi:hypothetical protein